MTTAVHAESLSTMIQRGLHHGRIRSDFDYHPADFLFAAVNPRTWDDVMIERDDWRRLVDPDGNNPLARRLPELGTSNENEWVRLRGIPTFSDDDTTPGQVRVWCSWTQMIRLADLYARSPSGHPGNWMQIATRSGRLPRVPERLVVERDGGQPRFSLRRSPVARDESLHPDDGRFFCAWAPATMSA